MMSPESNSFRPEMVTQPHDNATAPPSAVRAAMLDSGFVRIHVLEEIADDENAAARDRIAAIGVMLEVGLGSDVSIDDVRADE